MATLNDATFQEHAIAQWQDWRRFLSLSLQLIDARAATACEQAAFEIDSSADREREIKAQLAAIPTDVRAIFEREAEARGQEVHARMDAERRASGDAHSRPLDADDVERAALTALLDEAEGSDTEGIGTVPMADGWYDVDAEKLRGVPDESRYRLAGSKRLPAPKIAMMVGLALLGALAIWWTRPARAPLASAAGAMEVLVNEQVASPWVPRSLTLVGAQQVTLPVAEGTAEGSAQWQRDAWPLRLCVPEAALAGVTSARLVSAGDAPERTYVIRDVAPDAADLVLVPCGGRGQPHYAVFEAARVPQAHAVGEAGQLGDGRAFTLETLAVIGPGQDPTLPQGKAQIAATIAAPAADWPRLNATLRWPDGQDLLPSAAEPHDGGITFRYLVPLFGAPIELVQLRVADPASGEAVYWQAPLSPPPSRAEVVAQALADLQAQAERGPSGELHVTLVLTNGRAPLALGEGDVVVMQGSQRIELPALQALRTPLAPGERRTVELTLNIAQHESLTLSVGAFGFQVTT